MAELLQRGDDPTVVDARGKPPYAVAASKEVRDAFRRYMASEEAWDWDWAAAGIPSALTPEMEAQQAARQVCLLCSHLPEHCSATQSMRLVSE